MLGRSFQKCFGQDISNLAINGNSPEEIVKYCKINEEFRISYETSIDSLLYALFGHPGGFGISQYKGLLTKDQRREYIKLLESRV